MLNFKLKLASLASALALAAGVAFAQNVPNYSTQGGSLWVVGGDIQTDAGQSLQSLGLLGTMPRIDSPADDFYLVAPASGTLVGLRAIANNAITTPTTISVSIAGVYVTGGSLTIPSLTGVVGVATPTAGNVVAAGQAIRVQTGGETNVSSTATIMLLLQRD